MELSSRFSAAVVPVVLIAWSAFAGSDAAAGTGDCLPPLSPCASPTYRIRADLDLETRTVRATTEIRWTNCSNRSLGEIPLRMPAAGLLAPRSDLDDMNFPWRYPGGISLAACSIDRVEITEGPALSGPLPGACALTTSLPLEFPLEAGDTMTLVIETRVTAPERFGTFGAARGMLTMRGGWHPTLPVLEADGFREAVGAGPRRVDAAVAPSAKTRVLLGTSLEDAGPGRPISWSGVVREPLSLLVAPDLRRTEVSVGRRRIDLIHRSPPPGFVDPYTPGEVLRTDWLGARLRGLRRVLESLEDPFDRGHWTLVVVPMSEVLAVPAEEVIYVSESLYEITPVSLLMRYHDAVLNAALLSASLRRARPEVHPWLALVTGAGLRGLSLGGRDLDEVGDLARRGEFIYAVDQFGTDAQIPQEDLLFQRVQDENPYATEAEFLGADLPSPWTAAGLLREIAAAARDEAGQTSAFCAWVRGGHRSELDLSIRLDGGSVRAKRYGPGCGLPVRVRLEGPGSEVRDVVWDTSRETADWRLDGRVLRARADPDGRILQRRRAPTQDVRYNDADRQDLKWILARPWISFASGERIPTAYVELNLQRRYDLRSTWVLQPRTFPSRGELLVGHRWGFGRLARPNRTRWQLTLGLKGAAGFERGGSFSPSLKTMLYFDNRRALFNPFRGGWAYAYAEGFPGDSLVGWRASAKLGLGGAKLFGARPDFVFALRGVADTRIGETPDWEQLQVGGILGVRGLTVADFAPKHRLAASAELRWAPMRNLRVSFARFIFLRAVQLVLFSDAALLGADHDQWFEERNVYQSAGLGLRVHAELFGVFPAILAIDEAAVLPLYGRQVSFGTLVYFSQAF